MKRIHGPWRRVGMLAMGLALLAGVGAVLLTSGPLAPVRVQVAAVQQGSVQPALFGVGTVQARNNWAVGPTATGRVLRVLVDVGDVVERGQLLAEMDPVDQAERLQALQAGVQRAHSAQAAAQAQRDESLARRQQALLTAQRNEELARQRFISASALEARRAELAQAEAAVAQAQANLRSSAQEIERLQAERAALLRQRGALRMLAPARAVVLSREAEPGSTVVAGQPVLKLMDPDSLWVRMRVDQGRSSGLALGLPAQITLRSRPGAVLDGRVARVDPLADAVTEERIAQVALDAVPGAPLPAVGETAEVTLRLPATPSAALVDNASITHFQGQTGVWQLQDGRVHFVPVRLGPSSLEGQVQVLHGLQVGATVVVHSQAPLRPGQRVRVQESLLAQGSAP